jgi:hypothetical protein
VLRFFFIDLKNSTFFLWAEKKGVLSFTKKIRKFRCELRGLNTCARTTRKLPNAKSLQQILTLTRKYTLHSILRSLFESLVRVSLPSSPRARASRLIAFFFSKKVGDGLPPIRDRWI